MRKILLIGLGIVLATVLVSVLTASLFANPADLPQDLSLATAVTASNHLVRLPSGEIALLTYDSAGGFNILFVHSYDNGATWSAPDTLNPDPYVAPAETEPPELRGGPDGALYAVWNGLSGARGDSTDVFFARRPAGDTLWTAPTMVAAGRPGHFAAGPRLAVDGSGKLHVVWYDESDTDSDILYASSADTGNTWTTPVAIDDTDEFAQTPCIAADGQHRVHVAYVEIVDIAGEDYKADQVRYQVSEDGGTTWSVSSAVSAHGASHQSTYGLSGPTLAVAPDSTVHLAWVDDGTGERDIFWARQRPGVVWTSPVNVSASDAVLSFRPSLAADTGGRVHLAYQEAVGAEHEIYYAVYDTSWSDPQNLSASATDSQGPTLAPEVGRAGWLGAWLERVGTTPPVRYRVAFQLSQDEVWPGDTDQNGTVNALDVVGVAVHWTETGAARSGPGRETWTAQAVDPWLPFAGAHADANGDGVVDARDVLPIGVNWARTHEVSGPASAPSLDEMDHRLYLAAYRELRQALAGSPPSEPVAAMLALLDDLIARGEGRGAPGRVEPQVVRILPNPFDDATRVGFRLVQSAEIALTVFDATGRRVREVTRGWREAGEHEVRWDGRDDAGRPVPAGLYFCRLEGPQGSAEAKVLRLR